MASEPPKNDFFASRLRGSAARAIPLDNVTKLTGPETYEAWAITMTAVFRGQKLLELVLDGKKPEENDSPKEKEAYSDLSAIAVNIYLQVISPKILHKILKLEDLHLMWNNLTESYYQNSSFTLVHQLRSVALLMIAYDPSRTVASVVDEFESEYDRLTTLARESSNSNRQKLADFLDDDEIKRSYLLSSFCEHHKDVVDNLTTKDNVTYAVVKQRLLDLDRSAPPPMALITQASRVDNRPLKSRNPTKVFKRSKHPSLKECSFCKKNFPSEAKGHIYNDCPRLKEKLSLKTAKKPEISVERANITVTGVDNNDSNNSFLAPVM